MKTAKVIALFLMVLTLLSYKKTNPNFQIIPIPNDNFDSRDDESLPDWQTNNGEVGVPTFETYSVQKMTHVYKRVFAAIIYLQQCF